MANRIIAADAYWKLPIHQAPRSNLNLIQPFMIGTDQITLVNLYGVITMIDKVTWPSEIISVGRYMWMRKDQAE